MSKPQWKIDRDRREAEAARKKAEEAAAKEAKIKAELGEREKELAAERARRDAEDEKRIQEDLARQRAAGVTNDKSEALKKAEAERRKTDITCTKCGQSLINSGPFTRVGPENVEYEKRDPYHKTCLYCDHCGKRNPGIHMIDNKLICFDCRSAQAAKRGDTVVTSGVSEVASTPAAAPAAASNANKAQFCGQCGKKRLENAAFCGECGSKF
mmetsp:Transcript_9086/g.15497  ORF Transcript_9086/g.15497 Transcript_9086/m.15497 type:complete len:212 (+) Transcript_9086:42-677(+)